jgi:hypothetical protein
MLCNYSLDDAVRVCPSPENIPPSLYSVGTGGPSAAGKGADVLMVTIIRHLVSMLITRGTLPPLTRTLPWRSAEFSTGQTLLFAIKAFF